MIRRGGRVLFCSAFVPLEQNENKPGTSGPNKTRTKGERPGRGVTLLSQGVTYLPGICWRLEVGYSAAGNRLVLGTNLGQWCRVPSNIGYMCGANVLEECVSVRIQYHMALYRLGYDGALALCNAVYNDR